MTLATAIAAIKARRPTVDSVRGSKPLPQGNASGAIYEVSRVVTAAEDTANQADFVTPFSSIASFTFQVLAVTTNRGKTDGVAGTIVNGNTIRIADGSVTIAAGDTITITVRGT